MRKAEVLVAFVIVCIELVKAKCPLVKMPADYEGYVPAGSPGLGCTKQLLERDGLENGASCYVQCQAGYRAVEPGALKYTCSATGQLTAPKLTCKGYCTMPNTFGTGFKPACVGGNTKGCHQGTASGNNKGACRLDDKNFAENESCSVACMDGYKQEGNGRYFCERPPQISNDGTICTPQLCAMEETQPDGSKVKKLPDGAQGTTKNGEQACAAGIQLTARTEPLEGTTAVCDVECMPNLIPTCDKPPCVQEPLARASCELRGGEVIFTYPTLKCVRQFCTLPLEFGSDIVGGNSNMCLPGGTLASGESCLVACASGFTAQYGSNKYSCVDGVLIKADLRCSGVSCTLPTILGTFMEAGHSRDSRGASTSVAYDSTLHGQKEGCVLGQPLASDTSCGVRCLPGYTPLINANSGNTIEAVYKCFGGALEPPNFYCASSSRVVSTFDVTTNVLTDEELNCMLSNTADKTGLNAWEVGAAVVQTSQSFGGGVLDATSAVLPTAVMFTPPLDSSGSTLNNFVADLVQVNAAQTCNKGAPQNWNRLLGTTIEAQQCAVEADPTCFDEIYPCAQCCRNDVNNFGISCWDAQFTRARCCAGSTAAPQMPQFADPVYQDPKPTASPQASSTCSKNLGCFDIFYPCQSCCTTGLSIYGTTCWDQVFTPQACCLAFEDAAATQAPASNALPMYATNAPTPTCPYEKAPELQCFNSFYPCLDCCTTGISPYFRTSCWDNVYTAEKCCKFVAGSLAPPANAPISTSCSDQEAVCRSWAIAGECDGINTPWVKELCPVSCGLCSTATAAPVLNPAVFIPAPVFTPVFVQPAVPSGCADLNPACVIWGQIGECSGPASSYVRQQCPKACGTCGRRNREQPIVGLHKDQHGNVLDSRNRSLRSMVAVFINQDGAYVDSRGHALPTPSEYDSRGNHNLKQGVSTASSLAVAFSAICGIAVALLALC